MHLLVFKKNLVVRTTSVLVAVILFYFIADT